MSHTRVDHGRDVGAMDALFWDLRRSCALGRVLEIGCGTGQFVRRLVEHGVNAFGTDRDPDAVREVERHTPGRCRTMTDGALPFADDEFDTVVCVRGLASAPDEEIERLAREIRRVASRHVFLRLETGSDARTREWWDAQFLRAGFRRHPALLRIVEYASLDDESRDIVLLFENIPDAALARYPLADLAAERDLHMDMLREAGRRSDAHLQRYAFAAGLVRPNDTVLDVSCGLGYGLATMGATGRAARLIGIDNSPYAVDYARAMYGGVAAAVEFRLGDAHDLAGVADHSVDLVVSFETIEHLADPTVFLRHVTRVLTPGGRFVGSVPNQWLDETGRDPNPHHLHVFDADRLQALFGAPFLIEHLFAETAGGGMKVLRDPVRAWRRVDRRHTRDESAEWWVIVAMADPRAGTGVPYVETVRAVPAGGYTPASVSFPEAYTNPWIRNAIVSQGIRVGDADLLRTVAADVERRAIGGSVEQGAALCVQGHQMLALAQADHAAVSAGLARISAWLAHAGETRHHRRWRVSLESLAGRLCLYAGMRDDAVRWFMQCADRDALAFSPLLATKTVEAAFLAGAIHAGNRDLASARQWWSAGLRQASRARAGNWREIVGDADRPFGFGLRELGEVLDHAARCAAGLNALDTWDTAPGRLAELLTNDCRADQERVRELDVARRLRAIDAPAAAPGGPAEARADAEARALRDQLHDANERLSRLRALAAARPRRGSARTAPRGIAGGSMHRIVIFDSRETGRRLWDQLAARPTVEVVGFVDPDARRHGRAFLGTTVHPLEWLREGEWDHVAVAASQTSEWRFPLAAAGVAARQIIELPLDDGDAFLAEIVAEMFPDPLADVLRATRPGPALRVGIFGTGAAGMKVWEVLAEMDTVDAVWFADNNASQQGTTVLGLEVIAPADIPSRDVDAVVIGSMSRDPILKQLLALGVPSTAILAPAVTLSIERLRHEIAGALKTVTLRLEQVS